MVETLWLARHGSRLDFVDPDWHRTAERRHDPPLSPDGLVQGAQLGARLKDEGISQVFSSPFLRCIMTADIAARELRRNVRSSPGSRNGLILTGLRNHPHSFRQKSSGRQFPRIDHLYLSRVEPSYPETGETVLKRRGTAIEAVAREHEGATLVVGHGATVYGSLVHLLQIPAKRSVAATRARQLEGSNALNALCPASGVIITSDSGQTFRSAQALSTGQIDFYSRAVC
jgi:broad specificity phosphatase PhoE